MGVSIECGSALHSIGALRCRTLIEYFPDLMERNMELGNYLLSVLVSLVAGIGGFLLLYKLFNWITPQLNFPDELKQNNMSVAIFLAGLFVGFGLVIGSAVK